MILEQHKDKWAVNEATGCFDWIGARNRDGYGVVMYEGKPREVHRLVCIEATGRDPGHNCESSHVCERPMCVNPAHLIWETHQENMARKYAGKGKGVKCTRNGRYQARAMIKRKAYTIGTFDTYNEAREAYLTFWREHNVTS